MRPEIKNLHTQHKTALVALDKITGDMDAMRNKLADLEKLEAAIQPALAVDTGDVESIIAGRLEAAGIQQRREVIGELKVDLQRQIEALKTRQFEARGAVNLVAGMAWHTLAESLVKEHTDTLRHIGQVAEKAGYPLARFFAELPYLSNAEVVEIEKREGFPQWL